MFSVLGVDCRLLCQSVICGLVALCVGRWGLIVVELVSAGRLPWAGIISSFVKLGAQTRHAFERPRAIRKGRYRG